jgi:membrane associated rhomboid family serine protease
MARSARLTHLLAVITALAWLTAFLTGTQPWAAEQGGVIPARIFGSGGFIVPAWLTPLTCTMVHGGFVHLAFNLVMLVFCGRQIEPVLGRWPFLVLYVVGAYAAAGAQTLVNPGSVVPMIGASGAISAVLAVYALLFSRNEVKRIGPVPAHWVRALWLAAGWIAIQWMMGLALSSEDTAIATAAHVGGFLAGLALARPLLLWRYRGA